jgi:hypothetical protein
VVPTGARDLGKRPKAGGPGPIAPATGEPKENGPRVSESLRARLFNLKIQVAGLRVCISINLKRPGPVPQGPWAGPGLASVTCKSPPVWR